ncbi:MAG: hypothetical protein IPN34_15075 [Planctomycetes bacterium]|nr:hypothetical protein [Planctomycetota bacterium]
MIPRARSPWRELASGLLGAAAYGFALGSAHSELYAARNALKFPLLIAVTCMLCAPSTWIAARFLGVQLSFLAVQRSAARLFLDASRLLGGFSPAIFFVAHAARAHDDGKLGRYDEFLALNLLCVALAGSASLLRQSRELWRAQAIARSSARRAVAAWLAISLFTGGQAAFYLRPFFGYPASRGGSPPWFLGAEPDRRGATNFYEMVWQSLERPPLPELYRETR